MVSFVPDPSGSNVYSQVPTIAFEDFSMMCLFGTTSVKTSKPLTGTPNDLDTPAVVGADTLLGHLHVVHLQALNGPMSAVLPGSFMKSNTDSTGASM